MNGATAELYVARWTNTIHDEWIENLLKQRSDLSRTNLERTRRLMNSHVKGSLVSDIESLIPSLQLPDPDDRHVLAAAIHCGADAIVTFNLDDFPAAELSKYKVVARHPDEFLYDQFVCAPEEFCAAVRTHRASLKKPPLNVERFLASLERQGLSKTVTELRKFADVI